jgi:hypothetical protein
MTDELVADWLNAMRCKKPGGLLQQWSKLVQDFFHGHLTDKLKEEKCNLVITPGGMTTMLQPLGVLVNRPFEKNFAWAYKEWIRMAQHRLTPTARLKQSVLSDVCQWILCAWIAADVISKSYKVTGI